MSVCFSCFAGAAKGALSSSSGDLAGLQGDPQPLHLHGLQSERERGESPSGEQFQRSDACAGPSFLPH